MGGLVHSGVLCDPAEKKVSLTIRPSQHSPQNHTTLSVAANSDYCHTIGRRLDLIKNVFLWVNGYCNDHTYPSDGAVTAQSLQYFNRSLFYIRTASL